MSLMRFQSTMIKVTCFVICLSFLPGLLMSRSRGTWPNHWPKELETLRDQSSTNNYMTLDSCTVYEIPFQDRAQFERVWPHLLKLMTPGSKLILEDGPSSTLGQSTMQAGVRLDCPPYGSEFRTPSGKRISLGPPWPDSARLPSGELPEYVEMSRGEWVPHDKSPKRVRARLDILLVCDGAVVDLNRIPLPHNASVEDRRYLKPASSSGN